MDKINQSNHLSNHSFISATQRLPVSLYQIPLRPSPKNRLIEVSENYSSGWTTCSGRVFTITLLPAKASYSQSYLQPAIKPGLIEARPINLSNGELGQAQFLERDQGCVLGKKSSGERMEAEERDTKIQNCK